MGKSRASTHSVRQEQDSNGLEGNRQGQAHPRKASGHMARKPLANARGAQNGLAQDTSGQVGKTACYEFRCEGLGISGWMRRVTAAEPFRAAMAIAEAIDHDEARIMAFGAKKFVLELRLYGQTRIHRYEIGGYPVYKYFAQRVE